MSLDDPCTQCRLNRSPKVRQRKEEEQTQPPSRKLSERAAAADPTPSAAHLQASNEQLKARLKKLEDSNKQLREKLLQKQVGQLQAKPQANLAQ